MNFAIKEPQMNITIGFRSMYVRPTTLALLAVLDAVMTVGVFCLGRML